MTTQTHPPSELDEILGSYLDVMYAATDAGRKGLLASEQRKTQRLLRAALPYAEVYAEEFGVEVESAADVVDVMRDRVLELDELRRGILRRSEES